VKEDLHTELVPELSHEPDDETAVTVLSELGGSPCTRSIG
jgi:hypothetical protein